MNTDETGDIEIFEDAPETTPEPTKEETPAWVTEDSIDRIVNEKLEARLAQEIKPDPIPDEDRDYYGEQLIEKAARESESRVIDKTRAISKVMASVMKQEPDLPEAALDEIQDALSKMDIQGIKHATERRFFEKYASGIQRDIEKKTPKAKAIERTPTNDPNPVDNEKAAEARSFGKSIGLSGKDLEDYVTEYAGKK